MCLQIYWVEPPESLMQIQEDVLHSAFEWFEELRRLRRMSTAEADNTLLDLRNSSYHTKVEYNNYF